MKFVFIDKTEEQAGIIQDVLNRWNVPYHIVTDRTYGFFGSATEYNIEINVQYEFYQFLCKEIQKVETLEQCYEMDTVEPEIKPKKRRGRPRKQQDKQSDKMNTKELPGTCTGRLPGFFGKLIMDNLFENTGRQVTFDELDPDEQQELLQRIPLDKLKSKNTIITKSPNGISIMMRGDD